MTAMNLNGINFPRLRKFSALHLWEVACLMEGFDPELYLAGIAVVDADGSYLDLTNSERMLTSAIRAGVLASLSGNQREVDRKTEIAVSCLDPWLRKNGFENLANRMTVAPQTVAGTPDTSITPVTRRVLVQNCVRHWPTIERDLKDAAKNGLAEAAKAGAREWYELSAKAWARTRGKMRGSMNQSGSSEGSPWNEPSDRGSS